MGQLEISRRGDTDSRKGFWIRPSGSTTHVGLEGGVCIPGSVISLSAVTLVRYVTSSRRLVNGVNKTCLGSLVGDGNSNPPQSYCLENPMDRGAW